MKGKLRRILSLLICFSLLCSIPICSRKQAAKAYTAHTPDEAIAWAASQVGKSLEGDNYYGSNNEYAYQCVDFIICYYKYLGVSPSSGNGADYATNTLPSGWTRVKGGTPQKGDILVYSGNKANPAGHVGIYDSERSTYHQNIGENRKVTHETYRYNGFSNPYWGYIRPDWNSGNDPKGCVDTCESTEEGTLRIAGWAFDADNTSAQLEIHVYIGPEDSATGYNAGNANVGRQDVDDYYHCGAYHGFDKTITTDRVGNQRVRIFAINVGGGNNVLLYDNTVYIKEDTQAPELVGYTVTNLNEKGYQVTCLWKDNKGVTDVKFPTKKKGEDWTWYEGTPSSSSDVGSTYSTWSFTLSAGSAGDKYTTHIYAYDKAGNSRGYAIDTIELQNDTTAPSLDSVSLQQEEAGSITMKIRASDDVGLGKMKRVFAYYYSTDEDSSYLFNTEKNITSDPNCWSNTADSYPILKKEGEIEFSEGVMCDSVVGFSLMASDLAGNTSNITSIEDGKQVSRFQIFKSEDVLGEDNHSVALQIKSGETVTIETLRKKLVDIGMKESFVAYYDTKNERIVKKSSSTISQVVSESNQVVLTGNETGTEYVYFMSIGTGELYSCKLTVVEDENATPTPTAKPTKEPVASSTPKPTNGIEDSDSSATATFAPTSTPTPTSTPKTPVQTSVPASETELTGYDAVYQANLKIYQEQCSDEYMMEYLLAEPDNVYAYIINDEIRETCKEITQNCTTDMEKLQAIHDWICTNLYYDKYGEAHGTSGVGAIYTFYNRGTRCEGFADLTAAMCREVGIPCKEMEGYSLKNVSVEGKTVEQLRKELLTNNCAHAWNEAWVDGRWVLMDNTWDCQNSNSSTDTTVTYKKCKQTYFDTDLKEFSKTHIIDENISYFESIFPEWKAKNYPSATETPAVSDETSTDIVTVAPTATAKPTATSKPYTSSSGSSYSDNRTYSSGSSGSSSYSSYSYRPSKIYISLAKNKKKKTVVLKWLKDSDADFYQIQYSTKKSFKGKKSKAVYGRKCTIKKLKKGKTYYFRVRGYAYGAGYGKWSSKAKVKIKK